MLLALFVSTVLALPSGMDLELCFGMDGHIDFSLNGCQEDCSSRIPVRERLSDYDTTHHGECFDVAVACSSASEFIRTDSKTDSNKSELNKAPFQTPVLFSKSLFDSAGPNLDSSVFVISFEDIAFPHLVSLRTVVLLV